MAVADITPEPTDEEAAAIVAALQVGLPGGSSETRAPNVSRWRWSGRWWSKPLPMRRGRPG
ncbi:MAG: hypothetical protein JST64_15025 [Actinobacteria bacterium]|nr:hypothetical protein [Actinomycetota bacterium]